MQAPQDATTHISTTLAQQQGLHGSDSYRHIMYNDPLHRDSSALRLNQEALKAFHDTVLISRRCEFAAEMAAWKAFSDRGGLGSGGHIPSVGAAMGDYMENINYEHLKIASGFELHLKARLVANDFVVHRLDSKHRDYKALAKAQEERPIAKSEMFAISSYRFDGTINYLPGLMGNSLEFKQLTKKSKYKMALNLSDLHLDIIEYYRCLRNQIHLPGETTQIPEVPFSGTVLGVILEFVNTEIIAFSNKLISMNKGKLRFESVATLS